MGILTKAEIEALHKERPAMTSDELADELAMGPLKDLAGKLTASSAEINKHVDFIDQFFEPRTKDQTMDAETLGYRFHEDTTDQTADARSIWDKVKPILDELDSASNEVAFNGYKHSRALRWELAKGKLEDQIDNLKGVLEGLDGLKDKLEFIDATRNGYKQDEFPGYEVGR